MYSPETQFVRAKDQEKTKFNERKTINGTEIIVDWDDGYNDYVIYFPQIDLNDEAQEKGVFDQLIRIGQKEETAKNVLDKAVKIAESENNVNEIFKKIESYIISLPTEAKEDDE